MKAERNYSIDILKIIGIIFIINSHLGDMYGNYSFIAQFGDIGNSLFFFCSGYTLTLGRIDRFDNWYKRRFRRIYATVLAYVFLISTYYGLKFNSYEVFIEAGGGYWFLPFIMVFYFIYYPIKRFNVPITKLIVILFTFFVIWFYFNPSFELPLCDIKRSPYILIFLFGALMPIKNLPIIKNTYSAIGLIITILTYLVITYLYRKDTPIVHDNIIFIFPLFIIIVYFLFCFFISNEHKMVKNSKIKKFILHISALSLEFYIMQFLFITNKYNEYFPLNIIIYLIIVYFSAIMLKITTNLLLQTFSKEDFNWSEIIKIN